MKKVCFFILLVFALFGCTNSSVEQVEPAVAPITTKLYAVEYNRSVVYDGDCQLYYENGLLRIVSPLVTMRFNRFNELDRYAIGEYIDPAGVVFNTEQWFYGYETNAPIGSTDGKYFQFCGMNPKGEPICLSGYIGDRIKP
jgi:hypothetical protein